MALSAKVGNFNITTGGIGSTIVVTGVGFQPKAIVFFWGGRTTPGVSIADSFRGMGLGVSASSRRASGVRVDDGDATASSLHDLMFQTAGACIIAVDNAAGGNTVGRADIQSIDSDGFTLVIDEQFTIDLLVHYMALGGADLTDTFIGTISEPGSSGDQDVTTVGFQPDEVLFLCAPAPTEDSRTGWSNLMFGAATRNPSANHVWAGGGSDQATTTPDRRSYLRLDECIALFSQDNTIVTSGRALVTAFLSNGFRLNWLEAVGTREIYFLALKGGSYKIGTFNTSTTTSATIPVTGVGFMPRVVAALGRARTTENAADAPTSGDDEWSFGASTGSGAQVASNALNALASVTVRAVVAARNDSIYLQTSTVLGVEGEADLQSLDSDGFTLIQTNNDPSSFLCLYFAAGDQAAEPIIEMRDPRLPLDFLGTLERDPLLPLDFGGQETLNRDPLLPLDLGGLETRNRDARLPFDYRATIFRDAQPHVEFSGIDPNLLLHRWLVLIKASLPILHSWDVLKLAEQFQLPHEWTVKEPLPPLPHRWNVIPDVLTPFGIDPSTGGPLGAGSGDIQVPVATKDKTP